MSSRTGKQSYDQKTAQWNSDFADHSEPSVRHSHKSHRSQQRTTSDLCKQPEDVCRTAVGSKQQDVADTTEKERRLQRELEQERALSATLRAENENYYNETRPHLQFLECQNWKMAGELARLKAIPKGNTTGHVVPTEASTALEKQVDTMIMQYVVQLRHEICDLKRQTSILANDNRNLEEKKRKLERRYNALAAERGRYAQSEGSTRRSSRMGRGTY
ncbi:uncharacterized protein PV07_05090 [Cladophialophora immunda]|uniref:Uncharacterized protein n=1 Tax=Cladophialophora immunda TaxID=569365 RepID=A0A0D2CGB3_9EURO|nr:uncharacterized protein PV07_05090 [Cladophialophora immunda]KIW29265.1 hypothetical protein PV07_05090 [Cladophialophora immunda]OQV07644.1 hypothetical protein CLAIMM_12048 [Cladophialophora immunda]